MRLGLVVALGSSLFVALACGGTDDGSKVEGSGATGSGTGLGIGGSQLDVGRGGGAATGSSNTSGGGTGDAFDPNAACATSAADGEPVPVDLYFMVDITGSMNCPVPDVDACDTDPGPPKMGESRWTVVSAALKSFLGDPKNQGLGVGMRFFPTQGRQINNICSVNAYLTPAVEVGPLPGSSMSLVTAIDMQAPGGTTPTVPSLTAAVQHATTWAKAHPTHRVAVVYATDGYPRGCTGNTIDAAAQVARAAFQQTPSIPTYVLGVGPNLSSLEQIAAAGSNDKTKAFLVDTSQDAAAQLTAALSGIRNNAVLDCTYTIPKPPAGQQLETGKVNVTYTNSAGTVLKVKQDPAGTACSAGAGWQYSADGSQINLCGSACNAVKADPKGKLQVLFGCATEIGNPPK